MAVLTESKFTVTDIGLRQKEKVFTAIEAPEQDAGKGIYPHFMLKEIMEQPESLANALRGRLMAEQGTSKLGGIEPLKENMAGIERILLIGCGGASYAAKYGEYLIEELSGIPCMA